jgi:hypothetical protein
MPATVVNGFVAALFLMLPFFIGVEPCLVLGMLAAILFWGASGGRNGFPSAPPLSVWIIAAWVIGLGLTTPLYRPYPRLILPWLTGAIIGNSLAWTWIFTAFRKEATSGPYGEIPSPELLASSDRVRWKATRAGRLLLPAVVLATTLGLCLLPWSSAWQDRRGLKLIASQILDSIQSDLSRRERSTHPHLDCVIYVLAEPGLYYHLAAQEDQRLRFITQPAANLGMLEPGKIEAGVPTYLVSTTGAGKADLLEEKQTDRLQQMERYPYQPSDLVLLDEFPPSALPEVREATVRLLRILPIGGL